MARPGPESDFLAPSLMSAIDKGRSMVDMMNRCGVGRGHQLGSMKVLEVLGGEAVRQLVGREVYSGSGNPSVMHLGHGDSFHGHWKARLSLLQPNLRPHGQLWDLHCLFFGKIFLLKPLTFESHLELGPRMGSKKNWLWESLLWAGWEKSAYLCKKRSLK